MKIVDLNDVVILDSITIHESMKILNTVATKILFVVDINRKFIGTLTDGDIRRFILNNGNLEISVINACNINSYKINIGFDKDTIVREMTNLDIIYAPVINEQETLVDIFVFNNSLSKLIKKLPKLIDLPVVIMAGGKGTRMAPFTNVLPKPLIPIGEKTILELIMDEFLSYGINQFYFTINYKGEMIKAYFDCIDTHYKITYLQEANFYGTAGSLTLLPRGFSSTFIVSNCDIIVKADFADILDFHKKSGACLTIISSLQHHTIPYGVVEFENGGVVTAIKEKPEYSFTINTGVYILEPECLALIPKNELFHMTHLIEKLMGLGKKVCTYPINESEYIDVGQWEEYRSAIKVLQV